MAGMTPNYEDGTPIWVDLGTTDVSGVAANGGVVIAPPMDVMDQGRMAVFTDPSGAFFSVWQPGKHTGAELTNKPGSLNWNELMTPDAGAARSFYAEVLGVGVRVVPMGEGMEYNLLEAGTRPVAGMMQIDPAWGPMPARWEVYFTVEDCDASYAKALSLGGVSATEPSDSPAGRYAAINDPQGGRFAIIKNDPNFSM